MLNFIKQPFSLINHKYIVYFYPPTQKNDTNAFSAPDSSLLHPFTFALLDGRLLSIWNFFHAPLKHTEKYTREIRWFPYSFDGELCM